MSVFATNRFSILPDDVDSDEAVRIPVQVVNKEEKAAPAPPTKEPKAARKAEVSDNKEFRPKSDTRNNDRRPRKEDRVDDSNDGKETAQANGSPGQERFERTQQNRRPGGDRQRGRDRQSDASGGTEKRVFDRHSGTGRGREEKRGGAGRGNWGAPNDEENAEPTIEDKPSDSVAAAAPDDDGWGATTDFTPSAITAVAEEAPVASADSTGAVEAPPKPRELTAEELAFRAEREKEEKQMTLDEYLKTRKPVPLALPEARKAGEGEDSSQWGKFIAAGKSDKHPAATQDDATLKQPGKHDKKSSNSNKMQALLRFKSEAAERRNKERRESRDRFRGEQDQRPERPERERSERSERSDRPDRRPNLPSSRAPTGTGRSTGVAEFALEADFPVLGAVKG